MVINDVVAAGIIMIGVLEPKNSTKSIICNTQGFYIQRLFEPGHEISNNVVCASIKDSDQPAHTRSLIRAFASRLSIL